MKIKKLLIILFLLCPVTAKVVMARPKPVYVVKVKSKTNEEYKGIFHSISDSTITVQISNSQLVSLRANGVQSIKVWREGRVWRSGLIGAGVGAGFCAIIAGASSISDSDGYFDPGTAAILGAIGGAFLEAPTGLAAGALSSKAYYPNLNVINFTSIKAKLILYTKKGKGN